MTDTEKTLTTREFSQKTGFTISTITKMLRGGQIRGEKKGGKWAIPPDELKTVQASVDDKKPQAPAKSEPAQAPSPALSRSFDVKTFAEITYLTEQGVRQWLRCGRLHGIIDPDGKQRVDAANLDRPEFKHLLRN